MLKAAVLALPLLGACATADRMPARYAEVDNMTCRTTALEQFNGRVADQQLGVELLRASGAKTIRWVPPGTAITMDFRADRLTVELDAQMRVTAARCT